MAVLSGPTFNQLATVLNSIVSQATGKAQITPTNTDEFVSVAQVGLQTGYDPLITAISQILSKTIFSNRPYSAKFKGLMADSVRYGNHVRKLSVIDKDFEEDSRIKLTDGQSIDQYKVNKPLVLQTNFYGENVYEKSLTIYKDQLDCAFSGPEEFGQFIAMVMQNAQDLIEQAHEDMARMALCNFMAGKKVCDSANVIYLLDKYEDETGLTGLTPDTIKQPANFVPFAKWLYGYLKTVSDLMTERSVKFHKNFTIGGVAKNISRHTPVKNQKCYLYSRELNNIDSSVKSSVFNEEFLTIIDHEQVNYWQAIDTPMGIQAVPAYNDTDGSIVANPSQVTLSNVFGVIFDEEAVGLTTVKQWSAPTPFNAAGGYTNIFYHFTDRYWNDYTENAVVLILDHSDAALKVLTVESQAGTDEGDTLISFTGYTPAGTDVLKYKDGTAGQAVTYGMDVSGWTTWNGTDDITPTTGATHLTLVVANANNKALAAGTVTPIVVKE